MFSECVVYIVCSQINALSYTVFITSSTHTHVYLQVCKMFLFLPFLSVLQFVNKKVLGRSDRSPRDRVSVNPAFQQSNWSLARCPIVLVFFLSSNGLLRQTYLKFFFHWCFSQGHEGKSLFTHGLRPRVSLTCDLRWNPQLAPSSRFPARVSSSNYYTIVCYHLRSELRVSR